jgi:hypothetical protein
MFSSLVSLLSGESSRQKYFVEEISKKNWENFRSKYPKIICDKWGTPYEDHLRGCNEGNWVCIFWTPPDQLVIRLFSGEFKSTGYLDSEEGKKHQYGWMAVITGLDGLEDYISKQIKEDGMMLERFAV